MYNSEISAVFHHHELCDGKLAQQRQGIHGQGIGANKTVKAKVDKVASGGSKPTTVNISIAKFQDAININTTNLREGVNDVQAMLEEALVRVTNGVSQGIGN